MEKARLLRFCIWSAAVTAVMLMYVHLNVAIVRTGYTVRENQNLLTYFLDEHRRLVYNLNRLECPTALSRKLSYQRIELVQADAGKIYYSGVQKRQVAVKSGSGHERKSLYNVFDKLTLTAEARGIR